MTRPACSISFLLVLAVSSSLLLRPVASECVHRNGTFTTRKVPSPSPSPSPEASPSPSPEASPSEQYSTLAPIYSPLKIAAESLSNAVSNAVGTNLLRPICAKTDYPDVCLSSIQSTTESLGHVTLSSAVGFHVDAVLARTHEAIDEAKKVAGDATYGDCLRDCIDNYDDALENLETSKKALMAKDIGTVNSMLSGVYDAFACKETFAEGEKLGTCKLHYSPMEVHEDVLKKMTSNVLALVENLHL